MIQYERLDAWVRQIIFSSLRAATRNPKHKTEPGEHGRGSSLGGGMHCVCSAVVWTWPLWRRGPPGVQSTASLAHPAVDAGEAMTATTPIDAASRPRRSPTTRLRHSRSQLAACDGGQDRLELLVILFARARQADCGTSLLHRDGRRGNRRQRSGGSQGSDVSGAMQPDMSWPDGLKAQGFSGPPVISIARASGWSHGGVGDAELRVPRFSRERRRPEMEGVVQKPSLGLTCVGALFLLADGSPWEIIGRRF